MKSMLIARILLWQNRWLYLLLMLWPVAIAVVLMAPSGRPDAEDVLAMLHQECLWGLALVAVTGSTLLGNEERSRRIVSVLALAVDRRLYLGALWIAALVPLLLYVWTLALSGVWLVMAVRGSAAVVVSMAVVEFELGAMFAALGIFWSVVLPPVLAPIVTLGTLGVLSLNFLGDLPGPSRMIAHILGLDLSGKVSVHDGMDVAVCVVAAGALFAASCWLFDRRDLRLSSE